MSILFDRATAFYDQTRGIPESAERWLVQAVHDQIGLPVGNLILEIGVGTGRIALPLARAGYHYVGIDLSRGMSNLLRSKAGATLIELAQADAASLPFGNNTFDAVVAVHVFHLIGDWMEAMDEVTRTVRPGGMLLHGLSWYAEDTPVQELRSVMTAAALGTKQRERAWLDYNDIDGQLEQRFGTPRVCVSPPWTTTHTPRSVVDQFKKRIWSFTWDLSDETLMRAVEDGYRWSRKRWGDLHAPLTIEQHFIWKQYMVDAGL